MRRHRIFISYRRSDSAGHAGRLRDALSRLLGPRVFMDVADIAAGEKFAKTIDDELRSCGAVLAVIGPEWRDAFHAPRDGVDYVRLELHQALRHDGVSVVPVLVQGASLPSATDLPDDVRDIASRQAVALRDDRWEDDVAHLARQLRSSLKLSRVPRWAVPVGVLAVASIAGGAWFLTPAAPSAFDRGRAHDITMEAARRAGAACDAPKGLSGECPVLIEFVPTGKVQQVYFDAGYCDYKGTPFGACVLQRLERTRIPPFDDVSTAQVELVVRVEPGGVISVAVGE